MNSVLVATDLSERSGYAIRRAAQVAVKARAKLTVLHVTDDALPPEIAPHQTRLAREWLERTLPADTGIPVPDLVIRQGDPHAQVVAVGNELGADLIVLGGHRQRTLFDGFIGTTAERVLRVVALPVLVVHRDSLEPYRRVHVAVDFSVPSEHAAIAAQRLGFLGDDTTLVHVFPVVGKGKLHQAGVDTAALIDSERRNAAEGLQALLPKLGLGATRLQILLREGRPKQQIARIVSEHEPQLLIVGTRGHSGVKRAVLGSVSEALIRTVSCDILAVPPSAER